MATSGNPAKRAAAKRTAAKRTPAKRTARIGQQQVNLEGRERIIFQPEKWSLADDEDFEQATGLTIQEAFLPRNMHDGSGSMLKDHRNRPVKRTNLKATVVAAIIWIEKRHEDADFTLEDAREMRKDTFYLDLDDEPVKDPKEKSDEGSD